MEIRNIFEQMRDVSEQYCKMADEYLKKKADLGQSVTDCFPEGKINTKQLEALRKSPHGEMLRDYRNKLDRDYLASLRQYQDAMTAITGDLPSVDLDQKPLDVNDQTLQNALIITRIGKDLPKKTAREILTGFRTNKTVFDVVKASMMKNGVDPTAVRDIYPYSGEDMELTYNSLVYDLNDRKGEDIYTTMKHLQKQITADASAFGIDLDPFISADQMDSANDYISAKAMGLQSGHEKATAVLEML